MPYFLESGKLRLTPEEATTYRAAADRLHEACEMGLDLTQPIGVDDWLVLQVAQAALAGSLEPLDHMIAVVEDAIRSRREPT